MSEAAIVAAALHLLEQDSFTALSLREVTREAGIVPAAFYRHFESMEALGLVLIDESFRSLRDMLRGARAEIEAWGATHERFDDAIDRHTSGHRIPSDAQYLGEVDEEAIAGWAEKNGMAGKSYRDVVTSDACREMVQGYVDEMNLRLNRWEQIKRFIILPRDLSVEEGEITPSMKIKRRVVVKKFKDDLDDYSAILLEALADRLAEAFAERLGKAVVHASDAPGFIVNRVLMPMLNEACFALGEGVATIKDIDTACQLGLNHPMGPFTLADFIGLDTCLAIMNVLYDGLADTKYRPCPLLTKYVEAGWLGRKTQRGFYDYRGEVPVPTR